MEEADRNRRRSRELGALIRRIVNLTKYTNLIRQLDQNWIINNERPASMRLRVELFRLANEYIQEEWANIREQFDLNIFDILHIGKS